MQREVGFLDDVRRRMAILSDKRKKLGTNPIFSHRVQELDGFRIGFMHPKMFQKLCRTHGLDPANCEAILMQADCQTEPHVHAAGRSVFLPLGPEEGFASCDGGTFVGPYHAGERRFALAFAPAEPGKSFVIDPGVIHFFTPGRGKEFSAIAFVSPRIQRDDGSFDITRFGKPTITERGAEVLVEVA